MAAVLLDNNMPDQLGYELAAIPLAAHDVVLARAVGLDQANDSRVLRFAATNSRLRLTHDKGFVALDEAWADWMVFARQEPAHAGVVQIQPNGARHRAVARASHTALQAGWQAQGLMWFLDLRFGWRRMLDQRRWSPWSWTSPLTLL